MHSLNGKTALITGASRGIGRATALAFSRAGAAVYLVADGTAEELAQAAEACRQVNPEAQAAFGVFDLSTPVQVTRMVNAAVECHGGIDILVNNAGIRIRRPFGEFSCDDFDKLIAVNLRAPFLSSQAVLPTMRARGGGRIIHVASQLGIVAAPDSSLYGMAKAALIHMARGMAVDLAKDRIMVNTVSPGPIETEFTQSQAALQPGYMAKREALIPLARWGTPEEVAETILFLASTTATFIHGSNIVIDGGYLAR